MQLAAPFPPFLLLYILFPSPVFIFSHVLLVLMCQQADDAIGGGRRNIFAGFQHHFPANQTTTPQCCHVILVPVILAPVILSTSNTFNVTLTPLTVLTLL